MSSVIEVNNLSKSFILSHEGKEAYTALRDVISNRAKKIFSFPGWMKPSEKKSKELFWALKDVSFEIEKGDAGSAERWARYTEILEKKNLKIAAAEQTNE